MSATVTSQQVPRKVLIGLATFWAVLLVFQVWLWTVRESPVGVTEVVRGVLFHLGAMLLPLGVAAQEPKPRMLLISASALAATVVLALNFF